MSETEQPSVKELPQYKSLKPVDAQALVVRAFKIGQIVPDHGADALGSIGIPRHAAILWSAEQAFPNMAVSAEYLEKHKPVAGGYFVLDEDRVMSFCPADAFEAGYERI